VGSRVHGARHNLHPTNGNQVQRSGRFHGRMVRDTAATPVTQEHWRMYFDGSSTLTGVGGGVVLISPKGDRPLYVIRLHFCATNNVVEYKALINGLHIATELRVQQLYIHGDSKLIINQVMGKSNCHDSRMAAYQQEVMKLKEKFDGFNRHHILWQDNEPANTLIRLSSSHEPPPPGVFT
jgi:ribonuclease HI